MTAKSKWTGRTESELAELSKRNRAAQKKAVSFQSAIRDIDAKIPLGFQSRPVVWGDPPQVKVTWKGGWRVVGDSNVYFRSRWEANYGRYLEWLRIKGEIYHWEHEPETFWFDGVKRGAVSYLPDFRVTLNSGGIEYHEVKGWMDTRSATKIRRMAKYHPQILLKVIESKQYATLKKQMSKIIKDWE